MKSVPARPREGDRSACEASSYRIIRTFTRGPLFVSKINRKNFWQTPNTRKLCNPFIDFLSGALPLMTVQSIAYVAIAAEWLWRAQELEKLRRLFYTMNVKKISIFQLHPRSKSLIEMANIGGNGA